MKFFKDKKKRNSLPLAWGVQWVAPISSEGGDGGNTQGHYHVRDNGGEEIDKKSSKLLILKLQIYGC